jgi:hypothetical protein
LTYAAASASRLADWWNIRGIFGEHSGNIQGTFRELSGRFGTVRGTFREHSGNLTPAAASASGLADGWNIQGTFREHSGNIRGGFREGLESIQGTTFGFH